MKLQPVYRKVSLGTAGMTVASAVSIIVVWIISLFGLEVPPLVAQAITMVIGALGGFFSGYLVKEPPGDT